jgi:23S rRNA pseudouridine1911/1915/1917 synthase
VPAAGGSQVWRFRVGELLEVFRLLKLTMSATIKLSSPATREFWEIPILFEDEHLLALDKPSGLLTSPDRNQPDRPSLTKLLHAGIERGAAWATEGGRTYLVPAHRLEPETSGVLVLAKSKPMLIALVDLFGAEKAGKKYVALVQGSPAESQFKVEAKLAPHPLRTWVMRVDPNGGKRSVTGFEVRERFSHYTLLQCEPLTDRPNQIRVHLRHAGLPVVGDQMYGGRPLLLSRLKPVYRLKPKQTERPLIARPALHSEALSLPHPVTGSLLTITAPWPKELNVAVKYLRKYAAG